MFLLTRMKMMVKWILTNELGSCIYYVYVCTYLLNVGSMRIYSSATLFCIFAQPFILERSYPLSGHTHVLDFIFKFKNLYQRNAARKPQNLPPAGTIVLKVTS